MPVASASAAIGIELMALQLVENKRDLLGREDLDILWFNPWWADRTGDVARYHLAAHGSRKRPMQDAVCVPNRPRGQAPGRSRRA